MEQAMLSARIDLEVKQKLEIEAKADDRSLSYLVNRVLAEYCQKAKMPKKGQNGAITKVCTSELEAEEVLKHLNEKTGRKYIDSSKIASCLKNKKKPVSVVDCIDVINHKCREWMGTDYEKYLRPSTLFNVGAKGKFFEYLAEASRNRETAEQFDNWVNDENDQRGFFNV